MEYDRGLEQPVAGVPNVTVREIGENFNPEGRFLPRDGHPLLYQVFVLHNVRPSRSFARFRARPYLLLHLPAA